MANYGTDSELHVSHSSGQNDRFIPMTSNHSDSFVRPTLGPKAAPQAVEKPILRSQRQEGQVEEGQVEETIAPQPRVPRPVRRSELPVKASKPILRGGQKDHPAGKASIITPKSYERWLWGIFLKGNFSQEELLQALWEYSHNFKERKDGKPQGAVRLIGAVTPHVDKKGEWIALRGESESGDVLLESVRYAVHCLKASLPGKVLDVESYAHRWDPSYSDFNTDEGYRRGLDAAPCVIKTLGALADVEMPLREFCSDLGIEPLRFWERDVAVTRNERGRTPTRTPQRVTRLEKNSLVQVDLKEVSPHVVLRNLFQLLPEVEDYDHETRTHRRIVLFYADDQFHVVKFYSDPESFKEALEATREAMG